MRSLQKSGGRRGSRPSIGEKWPFPSFLGGSGATPTVCQGLLQEPLISLIAAVALFSAIATAGPVPLPFSETVVAASGGTETSVGGYKIHTFTTSGSLTVTSGGNVEVLVVAGGGGGGKIGGGGGAGGLIYSNSFAVSTNSSPYIGMALT